MDFTNEITSFSERVKQLKNDICTEEATKMSLIIPFFQILGYDVFNPTEFCPEYHADIGIKKGEKVDYAILVDGKPTILIEAKSVNIKLEKHSSQLFRYFSSTNAKFAILTNGIVYKFYTDLTDRNKMDKEPFYEFNILNLSNEDIQEILRYSKSNFDEDFMFNNASILKYSSLFKKEIQKQFSNPTDDFIRFFLKDYYQGIKTQTIVDKFRPVLKKSLNDYLDETAKEKMTNIIQESGYIDANSDDTQNKQKLVPQELEAFSIVKTILADQIKEDDLTYKKTDSYFVVLYKNNVRKWIMRLYINSSQMFISIPQENQRFKINSIEDIKTYKQLIEGTFNNLTKASIDQRYIYTKWGKYLRPNPYKVNLSKNFP